MRTVSAGAVVAERRAIVRHIAVRADFERAFLQVREEADVLSDMKPEADLALRREAVITAVVEAEAISPSDEEVREALGPTAEREEVDAQTLLEDLRKAGRLEEVREDLAARQAIDLLAAEAKPIPVAQAKAREQLWTPEKEGAQAAAGGDAADAPARLWTPDR